MPNVEIVILNWNGEEHLRRFLPSVVAVVRPGLDLLAALSYLVQGRADSFRAVFRAWRDFLGWHGELARKRRAIRASRRGSAAANIYRGSVLLRYLLGRRTFGRLM